MPSPYPLPLRQERKVRAKPDDLGGPLPFVDVPGQIAARVDVGQTIGDEHRDGVVEQAQHRKLVAEALGTAVLVIVGVGVATLSFGFKLDGLSISAGVVATGSGTWNQNQPAPVFGVSTDDSGALIVYEADTAEQAEELLKRDPFHAGGVFVRWTMKPWKTVFGKRELFPNGGPP